jgi:hypothetical protein
MGAVPCCAQGPAGEEATKSMHITEINLDNTLLLDAVTKGRARWGQQQLPRLCMHNVSCHRMPRALCVLMTFSLAMS